jgi:formylglycine-generating enzyme required for sulfatase activity
MNVVATAGLAVLALFARAALAAAPMETPMVNIPAGQFLMGDPNAPASDGRLPSAAPQHLVSVKSFQLAKYEVTIKQFRQFVEATGYQAGSEPGECWKWVKPGGGSIPGAPITVAPGRWNSPQYAPSDYHPVMCVSWQDAKAYAAWLSKATGKAYRLPSEAEWEYAARAGDTGNHPGDGDPDSMCRHGNGFDVSAQQAFARDLGWERKVPACDDRAPYTALVGSFQPNAFGLHDMLGNVGEYVEDCQHNDYQGAPADGSAWTAQCQAGSADMRITRGGNYGNNLKQLSFALRGHAGHENRSSLGEGFRLALDGNPPPAASAAVFEAELRKARR